jgi:hypothetical protein
LEQRIPDRLSFPKQCRNTAPGNRHGNRQLGALQTVQQQSAAPHRPALTRDDQKRILTCVNDRYQPPRN